MIQTLIIKFRNKIPFAAVSLFRGAVNNAVDQASILFHNHKEDGYRYAYPLIQYKRIQGCAAIVCIGEGTDAIGQFFERPQNELYIGKEKMVPEIETIRPGQFRIQLWQEPFDYYLNNWLALNQSNYARFESLEGIVEKTAFLEKILTGNILSMAKGIGIHLEERLTIKILQIQSRGTQTLKGIRMSSFDVMFRTNISLPDYIGLGKGVSVGYGIVVKKYDK